MKMFKIALFIVVICSVFFLFFARSPREKYRESREIDGQAVTIDVCLERGANSAKTARVLDDVWQRMRDIRHRMGPSADGDLAKINKSFETPQTVGADTVDMLHKAVELHKITKGVFDVTAGNFTALWTKAQKESRIPTATDIASVKRTINVPAVRFVAANGIQLMKGLRVDLDGIVNGYMIDQSVQLLRRRGYKDFLINTAGDRYAAGRNCAGKPWTMAIKSPYEPSKILDIVQVSNAALSISSGYEHPFVIQGKKFSSAINPLTGYPENTILGVAVIAPTAVQSNALSWSLSRIKPADGIALIDSIGRGFAALSMGWGAQGAVTVYKSLHYPNFEIKKHSR